MLRFTQWFVAEEAGQDLVEYALLAAFIATVSIAALTTLGVTVSGFYQALNSHF